MRSICVVAVCLLLAACKTEETMTVEYFMNNDEARVQKLTQCSNNPGDTAIEANCVNAREAEHKSIFNSKNAGMPTIK